MLHALKAGRLPRRRVSPRARPPPAAPTPSAWDTWSAWAARHGRRELVARPVDVADFFEHGHAAGLSPATLRMAPVREFVTAEVDVYARRMLAEGEIRSLHAEQPFERRFASGDPASCWARRWCNSAR